MKFDLKKQGFDVEIGELKFFFETTDTNMLRLMDLAETYDEKIKEVEDRLGAYDLDKLSNPEEIKQAMAVINEKLTLIYDLMLGDGAFERIYEVYPNVLQLQNIWEDVLTGIVDKLGEVTEIQLKESQEKTKALKAKADKKKK